MALGEAELGEARQWLPSEVASGVPSSVSPGPGQEDAAVLGVTAMLGAAAPGPGGGPALSLLVLQQGSAGNR